MWQQFISSWNGARFFLATDWIDSESLELHTDASGSLGFGGIIKSKWFCGHWKSNQKLGEPGISIAWRELFALVVACTARNHKFMYLKLLRKEP